MRFSLNGLFSGLAVFMVCILEVVPVHQNEVSGTKPSYTDERYDTKNISVNHFHHSATQIVQEFSNSSSLIALNTTSERSDINKQLKKHKHRKTKRKRRQHKGITSTTEYSVLQSTNQTEPNTIIKKKKRRKLRRRKNKKNQRKQQNIENSNILEVTTAKEMIFPTNTDSNSTINELIRKLNENPEDNFEEFRIAHSNRTKIKKGRRKKVANLVAPIPIDTKFATMLHDNITLHVNMGNRTIQKSPPKRNNRCRKNKGGCAHLCNPRGKIKCSCLKGFALAPDQRTCLDIDECKLDNGGCEKQCRNTLGTYECRCPPGLRIADDFKSCDDVNECLLRNGHGPCQDTCENTFGSYKCSCIGLNGTVLGENGYSCLDIDECATGNGGCSHGCINTLGKAFCSCPDGMELSSDWKTCQDIDECEDDAIRASCKNCINTEGSYQCIDSMAYQSDQPSKKVTCTALSLPPLGYLSCARDDAQKSYAKSGRERITNSPGTICKLKCPVGFRMIGQFYVVCGSSGIWEGKTEAKCIRTEPPTLLCPATQIFKINKKSNTTLVRFPPPRTNINWKYVKSKPSWAKRLTATLKSGSYHIHFLVQDPNSRLSASCTFNIIVNN